MKQNAPGSAEKIDDWHRRSFNPPSVSELTGPALQGDIQLGHGKSPTEGGLRDEEPRGVDPERQGIPGLWDIDFTGQRLTDLVQEEEEEGGRKLMVCGDCRRR